jgi:hypothetical protein
MFIPLRDALDRMRIIDLLALVTDLCGALLRLSVKLLSECATSFVVAQVREGFVFVVVSDVGDYICSQLCLCLAHENAPSSAIKGT